MSKAADDYRAYLTRRHRPAHARRRAAQWAAFFLPHLRPEMRVLDIGCGPGSITAGLMGRVVGLDADPVPITGVSVAGGDAAAQPFALHAFDAIYLNAVLQHVADPAAVLREALRVARPGAVVGVGDADWGTRLMHPHDPLISRGHEIQEALRDCGDPRIGRQLRDLLTRAGFERVQITTEARCVGSPEAAAGMATFEATWFEAPEAVAFTRERGVSDPSEMAHIAAAWRRWSSDPGACAVDQWFTALAWVPDPYSDTRVRLG